MYALRFCLVLAAYQLVPVAAIVKHGVIGIGISMYKPFCCNTCHDTLSTLYLSCTDFLAGEAITSVECRASNTAWLQSLAFCMDQKCTAQGLSHDAIQTCWESMSDSVSQYDQWVPDTPPQTELDFNATSLNTTSLVNEELYTSTILSYEEWEHEEDMHSCFAYVRYSLFCRILSFNFLKVFSF